MSGIELITEERNRQLTKGTTIDHDVAYNGNNELLSAIMMLAANIGFKRSNLLMPNNVFDDLRPESWDKGRCLKFINRSEIDQLKMIGAFAAAEIDRINKANV